MLSILIEIRKLSISNTLSTKKSNIGTVIKELGIEDIWELAIELEVSLEKNCKKLASLEIHIEGYNNYILQHLYQCFNEQFVLFKAIAIAEEWIYKIFKVVNKSREAANLWNRSINNITYIVRKWIRKGVQDEKFVNIALKLYDVLEDLQRYKLKPEARCDA